MKNLYMTYDQRGFEAAKADSDPTPFLPSDYYEVLLSQVTWGMHDLIKGHCQSFQIYNEKGVIVFDSVKEFTNEPRISA